MPHPKHHLNRQSELRKSERGNMLFMILMAIVLIGALTAAIQFTSRPEGSNIDKETLLIRATEVQRYASELERAVLFILQQNGRSESDIRFGHPNAHADYGLITDEPDRQIFGRTGGAASYREPPDDINDGSAWEFYGGTIMPEVGSTRPDLVAVLPNVTQKFCDKINDMNDQTVTHISDTGNTVGSGNNAGSCVHIGALGRFDAARQFYDTPTNTPNTVVDANFSSPPALQACVQCEIGNAYHFYHVILAR